jgi:acyl carrier protein
MMPSVIMLLDHLPITPNGKVDRRQLPVPKVELRKERFVAPVTELEMTVGHIWEELLKVEQAGLHDSFFELGGHSMLATQLMSRVRDTFQVEIPIGNIFKYPTLKEFSTLVDAAMNDSARMQTLQISRVDRRAYRAVSQ